MKINRRRFLQASTVAAGLSVHANAQNQNKPARRSINISSPPKNQTKTSTASRPLMRFDAAAGNLLAKMSLDEKIGQMTQAEQNALKEEKDIETYSLGSLFSGGNSDPKSGNTLRDWTEMYDRYQTRASKTRLAIPLLYGVDAVHGHNNVLGAVIFPHNVGLGCTRNAQLVEQAARATALEVRATGINWAFAPCVAVPRDERWGRTYEGFSESPEVVSVLGEAAVRGLQGDELGSPLGVLACAKHFVGDGGTTFGTGVEKAPNSKERWPLDRGDARVSERELREVHMRGYLTAIRAGVASVMPSYSSWNGVKCSASRRLLTEILKDELQFDGFLISDYNAIDEIPGDFKTDVEQSINAGMDMVMVPDRYREFFTTLRALVKEGKVSVARVDDAVRRILRVKLAMRMMDGKRPQLADRSLHKSFGSAEHRQIARECVRQSLVVLKNSNRTLPLSKSLRRIHVGGKSADDMGNQCGGWTISWQGKSGSATTGGTTILQAIREAIGAGGATEITYSKDAANAAGADVGVVVIGEQPYAEMFGDRQDLALAPEDVVAIENMKRAGIPVVAVLLSGRPMIIEPALNSCDAFVAAWLPGTEGAGVADVLFGDYNPTGKLGFSWPRSIAQIPVSVGDRSADPLFKFGFGLSY